MLNPFKRKVDTNSLVAVCPGDENIAVARVSRHRDLPPNLELVDLQPTESLSLQGAEIARLCRKAHLDRYYCVTTMSLGGYSLLLLEAPDVPASELRAAIRWRVQDMIDFHIDDAVIDVFEVPNQRASGNNRMMYAVIAEAVLIKQQTELLTGAGLKLDVVDIPELALRNLAALLPEDIAGVVTLYLERESGLITITRQSTLYLSRRVDIGYGHLGESIEKAQSRLDRIVVEIQRSLDYYESHFSQPAVTNVVIAPLPSPITGMDQYLAGQLGINVRLLDINSLIDMDEPLDNVVQSGCFLAIGAALREEEKAL